ncbi:MAG: methyltransferase domain-containing protein [Chloroflexi bacterium]|jgi:trans-aconitate 2-methyltransferase|nr:methyltransferase domain-containing protein [Chloroflexota bacterium]MBT7080910.1 methyltransferase domain-containing protein [Chloroflexota bacterium]MBT7289069.1 methyltransferase domain-containing protein [Chloroflexota bacterium]
MTAFEFDGNKYKQASAHQKEWGLNLISDIDFVGDESVLDLGCGDGALTEKLAQKVPNGKVLGIDASQGMIDTAKTLQKDNLTFTVMDIGRIDFVDEFRLIYSNATLHWVPDHKTLLANCYLALKSGGKIRFNFAGDGNCSNLFAVVKDAIDSDTYKRYFIDFSWPWYMPPVDEYKSIAQISMFKDVKVWEENADRFFSDQEAMIKWIDQPSLVPFLKHIPESDKQAFRDTVVEQMIARTKQADGTCFETFRRINLTARK